MPRPILALLLLASVLLPRAGGAAPTPPPEGPVLDLPLGHSGDINGIAFSPDCATVATVSEDRSLNLWEARTGELRRTLRPSVPHGRLLSVAFSPDGSEVAAGDVGGRL